MTGTVSLSGVQVWLICSKGSRPRPYSTELESRRTYLGPGPCRSSTNPPPSLVRFENLPVGQRRDALLRLSDVPLGVWVAYVKKRKGRIVYADSVVGMRHVLDTELPAKAIEAVRTAIGSDAIAEAYGEPIISMQDDDLKFPDPVEFAYYSIYNLFCKYGCGDDINDQLIINQALGSLGDREEMDKLLAVWP